MTDINAAARDTAISAVAKADRFLASARLNLIGRRLPLAGTQYDAEKALVELLRATEAISEAIRLIETALPRSVSEHAKSGFANSNPS